MQSVETDVFQSVLRVLQCPSCKEYMVPPINFCPCGRNICKTCRRTRSRCRTCKQGFLKTRNVALEKLSRKMKFPCRNSKYGCKKIFPYNEIHKHKAVCGYSPQNCPLDRVMGILICTWSGSGKGLKKHLQTAHKNHCENYTGKHLLLLPRYIDPNYSYFKFLFAYNEMFCYRLCIRRRKIFAILNYIGPAGNDVKYKYKLMVMKNEDTESVVVTHLARGFNKTKVDVFSPKNWLKMPHDLTECFRNEKGELPVVMKILRVDG